MPTLLYHHTQPGVTMLVVLAVVAVVVLLVPADGIPPMLRPLLPVGFALLVGVFGWLTVSVDGKAVDVRFGLGLIRRRIPLERIEAVRTVRNPWWYGYGVRLTPQGWMFNVSGRDAVELTIEKGRRFRIGTDQPAELRDAIRRAVESTGRRLQVGSRPASGR